MKKSFMSILLAGTMMFSTVGLTACQLFTQEQTPPEVTLENIELLGEYKISYTVGESFSTKGMVVKAVYSDNTSKYVSNYTYAPSGALSLTDDTVTVTYENKTANIAIEVNEPESGVVEDTFATPKVGLSYTVGGINAATGEFYQGEQADDTAIAALAYVSLDLIEEVTIGDEYLMTWFAYDANKEYLGNAYGKLNRYAVVGKGFTPEEVLDKHPRAEYVRYAFRKNDGSVLNVATDVAASEVTPVGVEGKYVTFYEGKIPFYVNVKTGTLVDSDASVGNYSCNDNTQKYKRASEEEYIPISELGSISINGVNANASAGIFGRSGYVLGWVAYDKDYQFVALPQNPNNFNMWNPVGYEITQEDVYRVCEEQAPGSEPVYIRFNVKRTDGTSDVGNKPGFIDEILNVGKLTLKTAFESEYEFVFGMDPGAKYVYAGESLGTSNVIGYASDATFEEAQDGTIYGDYMFDLTKTGGVSVYSMTDFTKVASFTLDKKDLICPHSNSVSFGNLKYDENDEFPLLYTNVYNNYKEDENRQEGTCLVYRLVKTTGDDGTVSFASTLVQVIKIGFTEDLTLWKSIEDNGDVRPYGNFVVDTESGKLYAYTMRDNEYVTRFFEFNVPELTAGALDETLGVNVVTLTTEDILKQFDTEYLHYMQGATIKGGKLYTVEGFTSDPVDPPCLRVIDLAKGAQVTVIELPIMGLNAEPEFLSFYGDVLYYHDVYGSFGHFIFY